MEKLERGLSGTIVELVPPNRIRKTARVVGDRRLEQQYAKQGFFHSWMKDCPVDGICIPKPFSLFMGHDVPMVMEMEYINGKSFDEHLAFSSVVEIQRLCQILSNYIDHLVEHQSRYEEKEVRGRIRNKLRLLQPNSRHPELIEKLMDTVTHTKLDVPKSWCHGDLTLSNMLFYQDSIYLIDFLDSFVESFLVDLVKLKQDLYYYWSIELAEVTPEYRMRAIQVFDYMWKQLRNRYAEHIDTDAFHILDLVNLLRIEPYAPERMVPFLDAQIQRTKLYGEYYRSDGRPIDAVS